MPKPIQRKKFEVLDSSGEVRGVAEQGIKIMPLGSKSRKPFRMREISEKEFRKRMPNSPLNGATMEPNKRGRRGRS